MNLLTYPQKEWVMCAQNKPSEWRLVLIWHRARKHCRFFQPVIGWWNGGEWRSESGEIYQPVLWKDVEKQFTRYGFPSFE